MKSIIRKTFIIFIIFVMMFDFIGSSNISFAVNKDSPVDEIVNAITNLMGGLVAIKLWLTKLQATLISYGFGKIISTSIAECCGISSDPVFAGTKGDLATPFDIFFNKYTVLDVDYFDFSQTGNDQKIIMSLRTSVAEWFFTLRNVCSAILLCILIYVGIRMALSTVAEEKAKFKKMLMDWAASLALIYVLQYIMIFTIAVNEAIVDFLRQVTYADIHQSMNEIMASAALGISMGSIMATAVYVMIMFQTIAFLITYMNRVIKVGFLILISPMISITYSIDKIGDGKAQALNYWLKEFVYCILIQPFHCVMYLAFVNIAISLMQTNNLLVTLGEGGAFNYNQLVNGLLVILCLKFINDGEKVVKKIFNFQETGEGVSMAAGMAMGVVALNYAKKAKSIGTNIATGANKLKGFTYDKMKNGDNEKFNAMKDKFKQTKTGQLADKIGKFGKGVGDKVNNKAAELGKYLGDSKFGQALQTGMGKISNRFQEFSKKLGDSKFITGAKTLGQSEKFKSAMGSLSKASKAAGAAWKHSLPMTMALMGAAMSYSTGSSGVMQAIGTGKALKDGMEGYQSAAESTLVQDGKDSYDAEADRVKNEHERLSDAKERKEKAGEALTQELTKCDQGIEEEYSKKPPVDAQGNQMSLEDYKKEYDRLKQANTGEGLSDEQKKLREQNEALFDKMQERDDISGKIDANESELGIIRARMAELESISTDSIVAMLATNGSSGQIESAKQQIMALIAAKLHGENNPNGGSSSKNDDDENAADSSADNNITLQEQDDAKRMQEYLTNLVDLSIVGTGASDAARDFITQRFGGEDGVGEALYAALSDYEFQRNAKRFNDAMGNYTKFGGSADRFKQKASAD